MITSEAQRFVNAVKEAFDGETLISVTFSKLDSDDTKIKARPIKVKERTLLCAEHFMTEGRVRQENISSEELESALCGFTEISRRADLQTSGGSASLLTSKKGSVKFISSIKGSAKKIPASGNDVKKNYIFDGSEQFLKELAISDQNGRVHDKKQGKFRQINRFAEHIGDILSYLPKEGKLNVADLCCGKSYLSFAVYEYLTKKAGREVSMTCVDLKESVIDFCAGTAERLGYDGMKFIAGDVSKYESEEKIDLVISLHACDTATDIVLDRAVSAGATVILATPCCQKELSTLLSSEALSFITKYPHLKMKFASTATDALRAGRLEAAGYKVDVFEFTDPEDTPKNTMIRAVLRKSGAASGVDAATAFKKYADTYRFLTGKDPASLPAVTLTKHEGMKRHDMFDEAIKEIYSSDKEKRLCGARKLEELFENGYIPSPPLGTYVNNHIHTTYSFSPYTPAAAVYMAKKAGLRTCGIMDHDSVAGALEFTEAGKIFRIPTTCGCEMRVKVTDAELCGKRLNNPDQVGCAYVALHGIPHTKIAEVEKFLIPLRAARNKRNALMVQKINEIACACGIEITLDEVLALSSFEENGGVTERHVLFALVKALTNAYKDRSECISVLEKMAGAISEKKREALVEAPDEFYEFDLLGIMKSSLIDKIYIPATDELPDIRDFTALAKKVGAISAYAYLGDVGESPTGDKKAQKFEDDYLDELFIKLKEFGFDAVTFMPSRNTAQQIDRVMALCKKHGFFMISGEDINSPRQSFICKAAEDEKFDILKTATWALIGHEVCATENEENAMFSEKNSSLSLEEKTEYYSKLGRKTEKQYKNRKEI